MGYDNMEILLIRICSEVNIYDRKKTTRKDVLRIHAKV